MNNQYLNTDAKDYNLDFVCMSSQFT